MKRKHICPEKLHGQVAKAIGTLYKALIIGQQQGIISQVNARSVNDLVIALDLALQSAFPRTLDRTSTAALPF